MPIGKEEVSYQQSRSPESISAAKERLLTFWKILPSEHKATIALLLVNDVMKGEHREWLQQAIALRWPASLT